MNYPILAIETSGPICSVAVLKENGKYSETTINEKNIHSEKLLSLIDLTLNNLTLKISDVKILAVSIGPGSFTGLRIGLATAKGIAIAGNKGIIPVPTFDALAFQIGNNLPSEQYFSIVTKVNSDEFYLGKYKKQDFVVRKLKDVFIIDKDEIDSFITKDELLFDSKIISAPNSLFVAKWAEKYGENLIDYNYDFLEPNYLKNFVIKVKK